MAIDLAPGALFGGKYRLARPLGGGGMGVGWAAGHAETGGEVAIKHLKGPANDPETRRRFLREGRAAAAVRHPNVVAILEVLELADGSPAIVMEILSGESLHDTLRR